MLIKGDNIDTHADPEPQIIHLTSATGITAERQALPTVSTLYTKLREAEQWVRQYERLTHRI
jgi:hypothetical protein